MEREYKITKLEKNKQKLQEDNVAISKMIILTSALVTIMNYANLGFSMGNIREFVISLLSIGIVGVTLGSILYLVKGAVVSLIIAALSLFIGLIFGILGELSVRVDDFKRRIREHHHVILISGFVRIVPVIFNGKG